MHRSLLCNLHIIMNNFYYSCNPKFMLKLFHRNNL